MKTAIIITARMESTRLPGKMMLPLQGKPVIQHVIERALSSGIDVMLMTPSSPANDPIAAVGKRLGVNIYRDSGKDRLAGIYGACKSVRAIGFATMDGDDLFCDPYLIKKAFDQSSETRAEVVYSPVGMICGAFTLVAYTALLEFAVSMKGDKETQALLPYLQEATQMIEPLEEFDPMYYDPDIRLTLDYPEDYAFFKRVFKDLSIYENTVSLYKIAAYLKEQPEVVAINASKAADWIANQKGMA